LKFAFIHDHRNTWPVTVLCRVLEVTAAGYYASRKRPVSDRAKRHATLVEEIRAEFATGRQVCGSPRLTRKLNARGVRKRLPKFKLPLAADDRDTVLDLQLAFARAFDTGRFDKLVDYAKPLPPDVKLTDDDKAWVTEAVNPPKKG
jgi:hypothetical protein